MHFARTCQTCADIAISYGTSPVSILSTIPPHTGWRDRGIAARPTERCTCGGHMDQRMEARIGVVWMAGWDTDHDLPTDGKPVSPGVRSVLAFIEQNFAQPIGLSELAALCGLSLHRFVTVFRGQVGIPPHQYLCRTRVRHARRLLREGLPLAAVAIDSGFCDQSHLSRHFKRQYGITPGCYAGVRPGRAMSATQ